MNAKSKTAISRSKLVIFTGLAAFIALAAGEAALRFMGYSPPVTPYVNAPGIHHIHKSNWRGKHEGKSLTTNSWGLRDDDFPMGKPPGERRILCVGDSVTFGHGVADGEDYPAQLEKILNEKKRYLSQIAAIGAPTRYQVINAGVCAYSPREEAEYYIRRGARFDPDMVIMGICLNDVTETNLPLHIPGKGLLKKSAYYFLLKDLRRRMITSDIKQRDKQIYGLRDDVTNNKTSPETERSWRHVFGQVKRLKDAMGARAQKELLVVLFPVKSQLFSDETGAQEKVAKFCFDENINFADPLPMLKDVKGDLYVDELHFNPRGCALIAQWLAGML